MEENEPKILPYQDMVLVIYRPYGPGGDYTVQVGTRDEEYQLDEVIVRRDEDEELEWHSCYEGHSHDREGKEIEEVRRDAPKTYPSVVHVGFIMVGLCFAVFCVALDTSILSVAIPSITNEFNSVDDVGWYGSSYLLTSCATQLLYGKIYSFFNIKWVFTSALLIFEIGSVVAGAAPTSTALIIGRAVAGLGSGGLLTGAMLIITHIAPLRNRPILMGICNAMFGVAVVLGPLIGGAFTDHVSWRWCFYINLPIGAVTAAVVIVLHRTQATDMTAKIGDTWKIKLKQMDVLGTSIFLPTIICLLLALQWGGSTYSWSNGRIIALLTLFGVLLLLFAGIQMWAKDDATIPPRVLGQRSVAAATMFRATAGAAFFVVVYYLPIWFQVSKGSTALESGVQTLPLVLSITVASIVGGVLISKIGYYTPFILAASVLMSVGAGLLTTLEVNTSSGKWIGYQILHGVGYGVGQQQSIIAVQAVLSPRDLPSATALLMFAQILGGAVFISVAQNVFQNELITKLDGIVPNPRALLEAGATSVSSVVADQNVGAVRAAYNSAIISVFYVAAGTAAASFFGAVFLEWKSVKRDDTSRRATTRAAE